MDEPTISIQVDADSDGTFSVLMKVSNLPSFSKAQAAADHIQHLFCGENKPHPSDGMIYPGH